MISYSAFPMSTAVEAWLLVTPKAAKTTNDTSFEADCSMAFTFEHFSLLKTLDAFTNRIQYFGYITTPLDQFTPQFVLDVSPEPRDLEAGVEVLIIFR